MAELDILIPIHDENDNIDALISEFRELPERDRVRLIFVDDGSCDGSAERVAAHIGPSIELLRHESRRGQGDCIWTGLARSTADYVGVADGDGQTPLAGVLRCYETAREQNLLAVLGYRNPRQDSATRKLYARLANGVARRMLTSEVIDMGCATKAFHRSLIPRLRRTENFHRYLAYQLERATDQLTQIPVPHRPRVRGRSKSGAGRAFGFSRDLWKLMAAALFISLIFPDANAQGVRRLLEPKQQIRAIDRKVAVSTYAQGEGLTQEAVDDWVEQRRDLCVRTPEACLGDLEWVPLGATTLPYEKVAVARRYWEEFIAMNESLSANAKNVILEKLTASKGAGRPLHLIGFIALLEHGDGKDTAFVEKVLAYFRQSKSISWRGYAAPFLKRIARTSPLDVPLFHEAASIALRSLPLDLPVIVADPMLADSFDLTVRALISNSIFQSDIDAYLRKLGIPDRGLDLERADQWERVINRLCAINEVIPELKACEKLTVVALKEFPRSRRTALHQKLAYHHIYSGPVGIVARDYANWKSLSDPNLRPPDDVMVLWNWMLLEDSLMKGDLGAAANHDRILEKSMGTKFDPDNWDFALTRARYLRRTGKVQEAKAMLTPFAEEFQKTIKGPNYRELIVTLELLKVAHALKDSAEFAKLSASAVTASKQASIRKELGALLEAVRALPTEDSVFSTALAAAEKALGAGHPSVADLRSLRESKR